MGVGEYPELPIDTDVTIIAQVTALNATTASGGARETLRRTKPVRTTPTNSEGPNFRALIFNHQYPYVR
jgi:hypothetical protein